MPKAASAGNIDVDDPPGITAFNFRPFQTPPANSSKSLNGVPILISKLPGLLTCPETE